MPVYQPSAIVGNSRMLVTLGARGELMGFFYPHIDFPQNLHEGMPAAFLPAHGGLSWTFDPAWEGEQRYLGRTNIVETQLRHRPSGLALTLTDFVHPTEPALFRRFHAANRGGRALEATLYQYLDLQLGEVEQKNAIHYHADRAAAVAYWRNICFAVGADPQGEFGSGRAHSPRSTKVQMEVGRLNGQLEEIGDIDMALGWPLALSPGAEASSVLHIAADANELAAVERVEAYRQLGWEALLSWAANSAQEHLSRCRPVRIAPDLEEAYHRSLLAVDLLADPDTGSVLAAPEFDPAFERCGGYGYCWPRDGVEVCLAMEAAGYPEYLDRFLAWARRAQREEGYWEQRYWLSGQRGPAWCTQANALQLDQTASVLFAMGRHARRLGERDRPGYLEATWDSARRAARFLASQVDPSTKLHATGFDLWETFRGSFTYSNAAIAAALREGAFLADLAGAQAETGQWQALAAEIKHAVLSRLWLGDVFARGLDAEGKLDRGADASALGLVAPFGFLELGEPNERALTVTMVEGLVASLGQPVGRAVTLRRFAGDQYAGGGPGALTTVWLARVLLRLALACHDDAALAESYVARAVASLRAVLASGTSAGLLPEVMGLRPEERWAVPHAWTMAGFADACLILDAARSAPSGKETTP